MNKIIDILKKHLGKKHPEIQEVAEEIQAVKLDVTNNRINHANKSECCNKPIKYEQRMIGGFSGHLHTHPTTMPVCSKCGKVCLDEVAH